MCSLSLAESNNMTSLWLHFHTAKQKSQAEWPTKQIISKLMIAFTVNLRNSMSALMAHDIIKLNGMAQHRQPHSIARYAIFCCCCWLRSEKEWCIYQNHFNHGELANWIFCCIPFCQIIRIDRRRINRGRGKIMSLQLSNLHDADATYRNTFTHTDCKHSINLILG